MVREGPKAGVGNGHGDILAWECVDTKSSEAQLSTPAFGTSRAFY